MYLGIDIARHDTAAVLAGPDGATRLALRSALPREGGAPAVWRTAMDTARETMVRSGVQALDIERAGLAFPARLTREGVVRRGFETAGWDGFDLVDATRKHLGLAAAVAAPRVWCEALGEWHGGALRQLASNDGEPAAPAADWLYLHLGATIGAAAAMGGHLLGGADGTALDIGAICLDRDGPVGNNGKRGGLDAYCGGEGFLVRARGFGITVRQPHEVWDMAGGNFAASSLCDEYVTRLAQGLGTLIAILNPRVLVVGGYLSVKLGERLLAPLQLRLQEFCQPEQLEGLTIAPGHLGTDAAVLGAIALARSGVAAIV